MTGPTLRSIRRSSEVTVTDVAREMGRTRVTIHKYEGKATVPPDLAVRYMDAVSAIVARREPAQ